MLISVLESVQEQRQEGCTYKCKSITLLIKTVQGGCSLTTLHIVGDGFVISQFSISDDPCLAVHSTADPALG